MKQKETINVVNVTVRKCKLVVERYDQSQLKLTIGCTKTIGPKIAPKTKKKNILYTTIMFLFRSKTSQNHNKI